MKEERKGKRKEKKKKKISTRAGPHDWTVITLRGIETRILGELSPGERVFEPNILIKQLQHVLEVTTCFLRLFLQGEKKTKKT